jgi:acetolactate synthase I/II/III large subunit
MSTPPPPPAGPNVADAIVELLQLEGVRHVFGIPGGALVYLQVALKEATGIDAIICRQETGAGYIADGYARVTGGMGVVVVTSGPGATNALTAAMNAHASHTPFLVITGEIAEKYIGHGFLQEGADAGLDVASVYRSAVGSSEMITSPSNVYELFTGAMRHVFSSPPQAAHLSLPSDVAYVSMNDPVKNTAWSAPKSPSAYRATGGVLDADGINASVQALVAAKRPLLLLGNRCRAALRDPVLLADLIEAVEHLALPVTTSPDAKGIFPETHALALRNFGLAGCAWPTSYMTDSTGVYDALLVMGSQLGQLSTLTWNTELVPQGPFIQVHDDPTVLGRAFDITSGVLSTMPEALRHFIRCAHDTKVEPTIADARLALIQKIKQNVSPFVDPEKRVSDADPLKPQALMRILTEAMAPGGHIMVDAGNCVGWCMNGLVVDPPTRCHSALTMGPMGFGMSVIGAKLAAPAETCISVIGDGAFMMHAGEVATAAQNGVGAIWIVLGDRQLQMVSQGMAAVTGDPSYQNYYAINWTDLAEVAQGLGAAAWNVSSVHDTTAAVQAAIEGSAKGVPQVIVVNVDTTEMPPYKYPPPPPPPPPPIPPNSASSSSS